MKNTSMITEATGVNDTGTVLSLVVRFDYKTNDPYIVTLDFASREEDLDKPDSRVRWAVGRELLQAGRYSNSWVGEGDVRVCGEPKEDTYRMRLRSVFSASFDMSLIDVSKFLDNTYRLIPHGMEMSDTEIDAVLATILERG